MPRRRCDDYTGYEHSRPPELDRLSSGARVSRAVAAVAVLLELAVIWFLAR